ncbi:hypothetical protein JW935_28155 [candidate division KSB1 bacterium]|nr:hypothetical protein [candidate division KSB1 bacterium]
MSEKRFFPITMMMLLTLLFSVFAQSQIVKEKSDTRIEKERVLFKELLQQNPNYFGNVSLEGVSGNFPQVSKISYNTKYEELTCVGLYPEDDVLEAVIQIKLPYGFKGSLCSAGSHEYVAFYIDYNDGNGFMSVGSAADVNVHDLAFVNNEKLFYAVRKPFTPLQRTVCDSPQVVKVRAILSWEHIPTGPSYHPVWGNVEDRWVQIKPKKVPLVFIPPPYYEMGFDPVIFPKIIPKEEVIPFDPFPPVDQVMVSGSPEDIKEYIDRSIQAEKEIKKEGRVEAERRDFQKLIKKNINYFGSITTSKKPADIMEAVYKLPQKTIQELLPKLAVNPDLLTPVVTFLNNTSYEELLCVGLYPEQDLLEAVIEVKRPYGFNGDLCTMGSTEYVAFYIDWGSGYQYEGTATVGVHDIPSAASNKLYYAVQHTIQNIGPKLKNCTIENIVKVKAVLCWNHDPAPYGHSYNPPWGNKLVRNVQIRPDSGVSVVCDIEIVNDIHTDDIKQSGSSEGLAVKIKSDGTTDIWTHDRPFGGIIACWGNINIPGTVYYRFLYSENSGASWNPVKDSRRARNFWGTTIYRNPDADGWFSKAEYDIDVGNYSLTALVHWNSAGKNNLYKLCLECGDAGKNSIPGQSCEVSLRLDNVWPEMFTFGGTPSPLPAKGVTVKDAGNNYRKCSTFNGSEAIKIFGNFSDLYFCYYNLNVFGGNIDVLGYSVNDGRYDAGIPGINDQGIIGAADGSLGREMFSLNLCTVPQTSSKVKCAYGIELTVSDRCIHGYLSGYAFNTTRHWRDAFVTFEWDPAGCPAIP